MRSCPSSSSPYAFPSRIRPAQTWTPGSSRADRRSGRTVSNSMLHGARYPPERRIGREITVTDGLERRSRRQLPDPLRPLGRHLPRYSRDRSATAAAVAVAAVCLSASVSISAVRPSRKVTRSRAVSTPAGRGVETIGMQRAHQRLDNGAWARAARPGRHAGKAFQSSADPASAASVSR
jgi:hypothetical protein